MSAPFAETHNTPPLFHLAHHVVLVPLGGGALAATEQLTSGHAGVALQVGGSSIVVAMILAVGFRVVDWVLRRPPAE